MPRLSSGLSTVAKTWKQPACPSADRDNGRALCIKVSINHEKEGNPEICSNMEESREHDGN